MLTKINNIIFVLFSLQWLDKIFLEKQQVVKVKRCKGEKNDDASDCPFEDLPEVDIG